MLNRLKILSLRVLEIKLWVIMKILFVIFVLIPKRLGLYWLNRFLDIFTDRITIRKERVGFLKYEKDYIRVRKPFYVWFIWFVSFLFLFVSCMAWNFGVIVGGNT